MLDMLKRWVAGVKNYLHLTVLKYEQVPRHDDQPYLDRWIIFRCRWFSILIHKFIGSDDECLHDHPWPYMAFLFGGGYWEWVPARGQEHMYCLHPNQRTAVAPNGDYLTGIWYPRWSVLFRPTDWVHRVETPTIPVWTLVIHGKKCRRWGFDTKEGWKHHSEYSYKAHCE